MSCSLVLASGCARKSSTPQAAATLHSLLECYCFRPFCLECGLLLCHDTEHHMVRDAQWAFRCLRSWASLESLFLLAVFVRIVRCSYFLNSQSPVARRIPGSQIPATSAAGRGLQILVAVFLRVFGGGELTVEENLPLMKICAGVGVCGIMDLQGGRVQGIGAEISRPLLRVHGGRGCTLSVSQSQFSSQVCASASCHVVFLRTGFQ